MDDLIIDDVEAEEELRRQEEEDMELALQRSLEDSRRGGPSKNRSRVAGGKDLQSLDDEIEDVERKISSLQGLLKALKKERDQKIREIHRAEATPFFDHGEEVTAGTVDYNGEFEWSGALHDKLMTVFGFDSFRSCQEG
ncbi:hypothetical protein GSI_09674 [Ganoderma sinense ZZ0214-1]|uniref:Uncharacterized protein n=1 Tax=Ganoderma sinense ZZ0214-1 TaxID=1077348 RepID=A0A2G8S3C9_9APHY|nr:hypothetical protein GSI_09674 [Ganoderma sinense ZZ0214-1]